MSTQSSSQGGSPGRRRAQRCGHRPELRFVEQHEMAYGCIVEQLEPEGAMLAIADMMRGGDGCSRVCRWLLTCAAVVPVRGRGDSHACLCAAAVPLPRPYGAVARPPACAPWRRLARVVAARKKMVIIFKIVAHEVCKYLYNLCV